MTPDPPRASRRTRVTTAVVALAVSVLLLVSGCAPSPARDAARGPASPSATAGGTDARHGPIRLPPAGARFDYQLGGASAPPPGVTVVERDHTARPAGAGYDICYVNGFQTQPGASAETLRAHPDLILHVDGKPRADPGWPDEYLFDTSTRARRRALAGLVGPWIRGCAASGYDAVEIDNLDSFTRSAGRLTAADNLTLAAAYAHIAHAAGLAIAQKNTAGLTAKVRAAGYDFAVTESCFRYDECAAYAAYPVVFDIEYSDELGSAAFTKACHDPHRPASMIYRDHDLVPAGHAGHVYRACPDRAG